MTPHIKHQLTQCVIGCGSLLLLTSVHAFDFGNIMNPGRFFEDRDYYERRQDPRYRNGAYMPYPNQYANPGYGAYPPAYAYPPAAYYAAPYPPANQAAPQPAVAPTPPAPTTYPETRNPPVPNSTYPAGNYLSNAQPQQGAVGYTINGQMGMSGAGSQYTGQSSQYAPLPGRTTVPGYVANPDESYYNSANPDKPYYNGFSPPFDQHPPLPPLINSSAPAQITADPQTGVGHESTAPSPAGNTYPASYPGAAPGGAAPR